MAAKGELRTFKMVLSYDGTDFHGWQRQPQTRTVQGVLEEALQRILGAHHEIQGAGRTDSGVHALAQAAHFRTRIPLSQPDIRQALRHTLPMDVGLVSLRKVSNQFHARYWALGKTYRYVIRNAPCSPPFLARYETLIQAPLHLPSMKAAAALCPGQRDFKAFRSSGATSKTTVRTLRKLEIHSRGDRILLTFEGDGFLYHMVRNITAALLEVGKGRLDIEGFQALFSAESREGMPPCAPARGLALVRVAYGEGPPPPKPWDQGSLRRRARPAARGEAVHA